MTAARKLPPPINPRKLLRTKNVTYGFDYTTSDDRYLVDPSYADTPQGGRTARIDRWIVTDTSTGKITDVPTLDQFRELYCAPEGKVPWLVCDMDDGIVRVEPTRAAAVEWACIHGDGKVISRERQGEGWYDYHIGYKRDDCSLVWIARADIVHWHGFDPIQQPLYPFPDDPYEHVARTTTGA